MRIKLSLFFILVAAQAILAQETGRNVLKGKINANTADLEGVYVINLKTEKSTITEKDGQFLIAAIPGDTLLFSAIQFKEIRVVVNEKDFQEELFLVKMESMITQLREVVVKRYDNINAVSLGISPSGMIHRTQAERKLYTAKSTSGDALLNLMSGRTAMLKKEMVVEGKLSFINQIENMFDEDYFGKALKIPAEYIKGFKYYIVDNERFTTILKSKNKTQIEFMLVPLAEKYNEIISNEK
ncbi:CarboxypepD_reg-like domain-containing protein [Flavobacterium fluvii]|uniref:CarboxypepD_reg-like domain-containing protein n=1 Tax=Flavobacterium fluvii TaxID=468056 RepID=A0A1M5G4M4_9FLAO|nr:carboxypeptidase-like regulatory domain-containing protein [Flavobacterium fluvii]SHF98668.1 CarboxypepD_reg-like domain-containing protein [Flavobacterium fluvii]